MNTTLKIRENNRVESISGEGITVNGRGLISLIYSLFGLMLLSFLVMQYWIVGSDPSEGFIGPNIWLMALMALIFYMILTALCWWLLQKFWMRLGLPRLDLMVLQFKNLELWQQLGFYWASFGLLLLAAVWVLSAVL